MALRKVEPASLATQLFGAHPSRTMALIRAAWPRVVGPELARRTEVVAIEGITLRVRVPDARWQKVLHRMQPELLGRLRAMAGELAPRRLGFVAGSVPDPAPAPRAEPPVRDAPPPSESLVRAADVIEDPEVRRQFLDTAGRYMARKGKEHA
jgi:hypothetical protein